MLQHASQESNAVVDGFALIDPASAPADHFGTATQCLECEAVHVEYGDCLGLDLIRSAAVDVVLLVEDERQVSACEVVVDLAG